MQVAAVKKQAAAAAAAAAEQMARNEEAHAAELGKIKSDATGAITTLMQVRAHVGGAVLARCATFKLCERAVSERCTNRDVQHLAGLARGAGACKSCWRAAEG